MGEKCVRVRLIDGAGRGRERERKVAVRTERVGDIRGYIRDFVRV